MIIYIVCCTKNGGIGYKNKLPWNIPDDLELFKKITLNKTIVMGRKTMQSINNKSLKNRLNIVLTHNINKYVNYKDFKFIDNYNEIIKLSLKTNIYVIGGVEIYNLFKNNVEIIHLSKVKKNFLCDRFINLKILDNFKIINKTKYNDFTYYKYIKI